MALLRGTEERDPMRRRLIAERHIDCRRVDSRG
jgi:hypothetical protein